MLCPLRLTISGTFILYKFSDFVYCYRYLSLYNLSFPTNDIFVNHESISFANSGLSTILRRDRFWDER